MKLLLGLQFRDSCLARKWSFTGSKEMLHIEESVFIIVNVLYEDVCYIHGCWNLHLNM